MVYTVPGKVQTQGPIATLEDGLDLGYYDKFIFNGEQFVQFVASLPGVVEASANYVLGLKDTVNVTSKITYADYKDADGGFRLVNGNPTHTGQISGYPTGDYDHVIIGYDGPVTTTSIRFWSERYVPVELVRVDYSHDGEFWSNIITSEDNVSFTFDSSIKLYSTETSSVGQYIYTVDLGGSFTAKYWRIRSFIGMYSTTTVADVNGKDVTVTTTSGLPAYSSLYPSGTFRLAYGSSTTWQQEGGGLSVAEYSSQGVDCVSWSSVTTISGVTTIAAVVMDESRISGNVVLPGWVDSLYISVYEDYNIVVGHDRVEYEDLIFSRYMPVTPDPAWRPDNWSSFAPWYRAISANTSNCYFYDAVVNGIRIPRRYGDCWYSRPVLSPVRQVYGSAQSGDPFYLSTYSTPFDIVSRGGFTTYSVGDVGSHGELIHSSVEVTSVSGVAADPGGDPVTVVSLGSDVSYASITSTQIQTVDVDAWADDTSLPSGYLFIYSYPMKLTQVKIQEEDTALLRYWESDGSRAIVNQVDDTYIYDITYDSADGVFYAAVYSSDTNAGSSINDDFSGAYLDYSKWAVTGGGIVLDTTYSGVRFQNASLGVNSIYGTLTSNYEYGSSFTSSLPSVIYEFNGAGYYGLSIIDTLHSNTVALVAATGVWSSPATSEVVGVTISDHVNASDSSFFISGLSTDPGNLPSGDYSHEFTYISPLWYYSRTAIGTPSCEVCAESVGSGPFVSVSGLSFTANTSMSSIEDYSFITFKTEKVSSTGITVSGVDFNIEYDGSSGVFILAYDDGAPTTLISNTLSSLDSYSFSPRISGKTVDVVNAFSSEYTSTGGATRGAASLSIVCIDNAGKRVEVTGVTDASGVVIGSLAVLEEGFGFKDYRGKISIATSQATEALGGSIFIRVGNDIYKYNKTTLPLTVDSGSSAAIYLFDCLVDTNIRNFNYDSFVNGGLHYLVYDDSRDIVIMKSLSSSTLEYTGYEVEMELDTYDSPAALDPVDRSTLFSVVDGDVYVMDMDATSVAFCNVVANDPILPANSGFTTTLTAFVTNLYGDPLASKLVSFAITEGGGAISPATVCTTSSGTASVTYYVDDVVGTTVITATASNTSC